MAQLEFTYDGTVKAITATENCYMSFLLQGGGGGGGGPSDSYNGSAGVDSQLISGKIFLQQGETVYCAVGEGGKAGSKVTGISGGAGAAANSLDEFSGGRGGNGKGAPAIAGSTSTYTAFTNYNYGGSYYSGHGIYVRTGAEMPGGLQAPYSGYDGAGWAIREIWVMINGQVVYSSVGWWNSAQMPSSSTYELTGVGMSSTYISGDYPGGGDFVTIYNFRTKHTATQVIPGVLATSSGGGGGGGGATVLYKIVNGNREYIAIAGGGGGGGGAGVSGPGYIKSNSFYGSTPGGQQNRSSFLPGIWSGGCGPAMGYGTLSTGRWGGIYFGGGIIPFVRNLTPYNGNGNPSVDVAVIGIDVTQNDLNNWGIQTPLANFVRVVPGQSLSWSCSYTADHNFDVGYWVWTGAPTTALHSYVYRTTHSESGRQSSSGSGTIIIPSNFSSKSMLVFGAGDRQFGCPSGMNSVTISISAIPYIYETRGGAAQDQVRNAGGPGGGGAGYPAGRGGIIPGTNLGAMSGSNGLSINRSTLSADSITKSSSYQNTGIGGSSGSNGFGGYAAFSLLRSDVSVKINDNFSAVDRIYVRQNDSWVEPNNVYTMKDGQWVQVYGSNSPAYSSQSANFNNTSGSMVPY